MNREENFPREVRELLTNLRQGIRRYVVLRGLGTAIAFVSLSVWGTFFLDWGTFSWSGRIFRSRFALPC